MPSELPFKFSYKVTDVFYAGEYPFEKRTEDGIPKLKRLVDFGIVTIIDLTQEPLIQYAGYLPTTCARLHFPTVDNTCPEFSALKEIHALIDESEKVGTKIYVHCKGGYDRTGAVVATYFVHAGLSPSAARQKFHEVFIPPMRGRYLHQPFIENNWNVLERYRQWLANDT